MRNTSESPDANEQAKATPARSRTGTRSKSEQASPVSQEQEVKKAPVSPSSARRGSSTSTTPPARIQATGDHKPAAGDRKSAPIQPETPKAAGDLKEQRPETSLKRSEGGLKEKRVEGDHRGTPLQAGARATSTQIPRQAPVQRQGGAVQAQRTVHPGSSSMQSATAPARSGSITQQRPAQHGQHATTTAHPGSNRPGGQARPGTAHPAGRNGTNGQRLQERRAAAVKEKPTGPITIPPQIVVKDLAELLHATPNEVIRGLIKHSIFASINQVVDYDKAALVAQDLGFEPTQSALAASPAVQRARKGLSANEAMMATRDQDNMVVIPPVVTIMGHVDHGKTSLLDTIRKTKVAAGEAGGITQHIGAYQVEVNGKKITFLDTPGHEAFTAMRARGAQVTHIAVIVVAADDGVMPQTREAIDHAQAAKVPIIIALNKIDKNDANTASVKQQLDDIGIVIEEYGGDVICVPVSARKGTGIDDLLEMILLLAEIQDIRANPNRPATGVIIEAKLEKNTGPTATVLIQQGTLKMGDNIVVGAMAGKVRAMFNDRGKRIQKAPPSTPVSILGLPEVPQAGDLLEAFPDERSAKQVAAQRAEQARSESLAARGQVTLDTLYAQMQEGQVKELNVVLKADVQGSVEAIKNALSKVGEENI